MKSSTVALLITLGVALFALWFFNTHHKVSEQEYVGPHGEARFNDHLAARLLFKEVELDAESVATLTPTEWMPDIDDTLFVRLNASLTLGDEQETLLEWVSDGGNLVLLPPKQSVLDTTRFLSNFGFELLTLDDDDPYVDIESLLETEDESTNEVAADEERTDAGKRNEKNVRSPRRYELSYPLQRNSIELNDDNVEFSIVRGDDETLVARRSWGEGYVTLFANDHFQNSFIGERDNGRLLLDVVAGDVKPNKIWMVYQATFSPLWEVIWLNAPYVVLGLLVIFLLWLWAVMPTFGPRVVAVADERRSIIEHVSAAGVFVWRNDGGNGLAKSATDALIDQAESRHLGIGRETPQRQAEIIARTTGLSAQKVMDILGGPDGHRPRDFTHNMQKLQSIRKEL